MNRLDPSLAPGPLPRGAHLEHETWWPGPLPDNVQVDERCYLWSAYAFCRYRSRRPVGVRIRHDCGVYDGTIFDLGPQGEVDIGAFSTLVAPQFLTNGRVTIGRFALISFSVVFADHEVAVPPDAVAAVGRDPAHVPPPTVLGEDVWLAAHSVVLAGTRLGDGVIVGAGTVVSGDIPAYSVVAGNPARIVAERRPSDPSPQHLAQVTDAALAHHRERLLRAGRTVGDLER